MVPAVLQTEKAEKKTRRQTKRPEPCYDEWSVAEGVEPGSIEIDDGLIELFRTFRNATEPHIRENAFREIVAIGWPENAPGGFIWHPWAEWGLRALCRHQYLAMIGCSASGKTTLAALWGMVNWLVAPQSTLVMLTSTTASASRRRVWGQVGDLFISCRIRLPGRLAQHVGHITTVVKPGMVTTRSGLTLIACERGQEQRVLGKIIGAHQQRMIFIADEMTELTDAIVEAAVGNLATSPWFQFVGLGNFSDVDDPLGKLCEPVRGWDSLVQENVEWETKLGVCIRFDGMRSPNLEHKTDKWPFLYGRNHLERHRQQYGENSSGFWRFCRSFPSPVAQRNNFVSRAEVEYGAGANVAWLEEPRKVMGIDVAWQTGANCWAVLALWGPALGPDGLPIEVCQFARWTQVTDNAADKATPASLQIVSRLSRLITEENVEPGLVGVDATSGGVIMADLLEGALGAAVYRINCSGQPTDNPLAADAPEPASVLCANRVSELWEVSRRFLLAGQLRGITPEVAVELLDRRYDPRPRTGKITLESKTEVLRTRRINPHRWDAACMALAVIREVLGAMPGRPTVTGFVRPLAKPWNTAQHPANRVYYGHALAGTKQWP